MYVCPACGVSDDHAGSCAVDGVERVFATDELSGRRLGPYRVATVIGAGGMGQVYLAVHPDIGSRVAIKVLAAEVADRPDALERFFAEARAVNLIRHENIVNILDFSRLDDGRPYIVMELIEGRPLSRWARGVGAAPLGELSRIMMDVLAALQATHDHGIVHRDLKPSNIVVTPEGRGKVLDFGVAKLRPEMLGAATPTRTGTLVGTPEYMAPEQALEREVDGRTDVYAAGLVLFECATGQLPFAADSLMELLHKHVYEPPPRPSRFRADLPAAFEDVVLRALEKSPDDRFPSARAMRDALERAARGLDGDTDDVPRSAPPADASPRRSTGPPTPATVRASGLAAAASAPTRRSRRRIAIGAGAAVAAVGAAGLVIALAGSSPAPVATPASGPDSALADAVRAVAATDAVTPDAAPTPPDARPKPRAAAEHSLTGDLARAENSARRKFGDARLVAIEAIGVRSDGRIDLSAPGHHATYAFASPSRTKRSTRARDPGARTRCLVRIVIARDGVDTLVATESCGDLVETPAPSCSGREVWRDAAGPLGLSATDVVTVRYRGTAHGEAVWTVARGGQSLYVKDTCD